MHLSRLTALLLIPVAAACADDDAAQRQVVVGQPNEDTAAERAAADVMAARRERISREELERARMDMSWMEVVRLDDPGGTNSRPNPERWEDISAEAANTGGTHLPLHGNVAGPSVLRLQILLNRALFSPGIMDGRWGKNTASAVYWFQETHGLRATARADSATFERLLEEAGRPTELIRRHRLTQDDVAGPFVEIPDDIYEHAELECSCYESLSEKLSERFHATPELLEQLNPGVNLDAVRAGQTIHVPHVHDGTLDRGRVERIVISGRGNYLHAQDAEGKVLYHFPTTLGARYSPSPQGNFSVRHVANDPDWHYQPRLLHGVDDDDPEAMIPAGPNLAVGTVWIALSEPHYGIHGTDSPESIGYTTSNGCVRLTNWDAEFLAERVRPGMEVRFRDIDADRRAHDEGGIDPGGTDDSEEQAGEGSD